MHTGRQRRNPFLIEFAFLQNLEARVEVVQLNIVRTVVTFRQHLQGQRQVAQTKPVPAVAEFQPFEGRFGDRECFKVHFVAEVDIGKADTGTPNRLAVARRVDDVSRQRGENAAVAFYLVQRQRRALFGGFGCGRRWRIGGGFIRVHTPSGCNQQRGKAGDGAVSLTLTVFFSTGVLAGFHICCVLLLSPANLR